MTKELVYYTSTDARICRNFLEKQGWTATVVPQPLVRSRSTYRGTIEAFRTLQNLAVRHEFTSSGTKDLLQLELASLHHFLEKITNLLAAFYETYPAGCIVPKAKSTDETTILGPGEDAGYLDEVLRDNGIVAPESGIVIAHPPVPECRIERPSIGLETLAPELLEKSGLTVVTEYLVEYRFAVVSNADAATLASCSRLFGIVDPLSCIHGSGIALQRLKTGVSERIQNTGAGRSLADIMHLLERPMQTADHREEYYRLPREFLKVLLYELGLFKLD